MLALIFGLGWAKTMFRITGIAKEMVQLEKIHHSLPYLLTIIVAILFFIFGLYGLAGADKFRKLPLLKPMIFLIAAVFLIRGLGELLFVVKSVDANLLGETLYSYFTIMIGLLYLIGGLRRWKILATGK